MTDLAYVLRQLTPPGDPNLLVGADPADDAAVYRLNDDLALVQTVDFFTPIVDDPYTFGQIAAANSLSDVYAMGAQPLTALNIVGFPIKSLPAQVLGEILRGGADKAREAGVPIVGGHTIDDTEPKYGLSVTGTVHPQRFITARGGRAGDVLVLTKPLGTGTISTALKAGSATTTHVDQAVRWMTTLNRAASSAMLMAGAHAATDITGFGLLGHLLDLCQASRVGALIDSAAIPFLPGALGYAQQGFVPGGTQTNLSYVNPFVEFGGTDESVQTILGDPQTSGGLLVALPPDRVANFGSYADGGMLVTTIGRLTLPDSQPLITIF